MNEQHTKRKYIKKEKDIETQSINKKTFDALLLISTKVKPPPK